VFERARVRTLDPRHPHADAVAVRGGRIAAIGSRRAAREAAGPQAEIVDCQGAVLLPGLIDPHLHLFALAARHLHLDCGGFPDVGGLLAAVRARAATLPPGAWVRGEGLDETRLGRLPTAAELDAAAPRQPVRLRHRSRHASVLNGRALRRLGPQPGIERVGGRPSGLVSEREEAIGRVVGPLPASALREGFARTAAELAARGLTAVGDATPHARSALAPLVEAMAAGEFPLRVQAMRPLGARRWPAAGRLSCGPVKIMVHETTSGLRPRAATLARRIAAAARAGDRVAVHCVGAATLVAAVAAFAVLPGRGRGHRLEHVGECPPPLVAAIARLGLTVVTNPAFVHWRGDAYCDETTGAAREWLYRAASLAAVGVALAGASDAPVAPADPWDGIAAARTRRTRAGHELGTAERLSAAAALDLFTQGAARAMGTGRLGRLVRGAPADLVVVEPDPLRASPDEVRATRVRFAMVAGAMTWAG